MKPIILIKQWPFAVMLLTALAVFGCVGKDANPYAVAQTQLQKTYALLGNYTAAQAVAVAVVRHPDLSPSVRYAIQEADRIGTPVMDELETSSILVAEVRDAVEAGETTADQLELATAQLNTWLPRATAVLNNLQALTKGRPRVDMAPPRAPPAPERTETPLDIVPQVPARSANNEEA